MNRAMFLAIAIALVSLVSPTFASDDIASALSAAAPAVTVNFDGSRHLDVSHGKSNQQCPPQSQVTTPGESLVFDKPSDSTAPVAVLIGVGVLGLGFGVAAKWNSIARTTIAVH